MLSDFDREVDRRGTNSLKWDVAADELPMWVADMDFPTAPAVLETIGRKLASGVLGYGIVPEEFGRAVADWWTRRHDFAMDPEWVTFCTGVVPALSSMVRTLTEPGDHVLITPPVYNIFTNSILNSGRKVLASNLSFEHGQYSVDLDDLEEKLARPRTTLFILCNPQNPTGTVWSASTLATIGHLASRHGVTVVSDEIHCDLTLPGVRYTPFASASPVCAATSITCVSPSKAFNLAGLQTASVVIPDADLRARVVTGLNRDEVAEPNIIAIEAAIAAFTEGEAWLDALRGYLASNREHATRVIGETLPSLRVVDAEATYLLWIDCSAITDDATELALEIRRTTGLILSAGAGYGSAGAAFLRLNLACPRPRLDDGLDRLRRGLEGLRP